MRRALLLVPALLAAPALAAEVEAPSRVDAVTVHPDGATVTRVAGVELPAGGSTVTLRGLPAGIDPATVRVEGSADAGLTILGLDARAVPGDPRAAPDPAAADRLRGLKDELARLIARKEALEAKKAAVSAYATPGPPLPGTRPLDPAQWPAAWDAIGEALLRVNTELVDLAARERDLEARVAAEEAAAPSSPPGAPKLDLAVALEAAAPVRGELRVSYRVAGAGWTPFYDARLTTGDAAARPALTLTRRARVTQRTGEDWGDVRLALSTVRTTSRTSAPEVAPVLAGFEVPPRPAPSPTPAEPNLLSERPSFRFSSGSRDAYGMLFATVAVGERGTEVEATAYAASFTVPGRVAVPADGTAKSVLLGTAAYAPALLAETAPALDPRAYLKASFTLPGDAPLLPGEVSLVRDGVLAGRGRLPLVAPGGEVSLGFGADDGITVTRRPVRRREGDAGLFGSGRTDLRDHTVVVRNLHPGPVHLRVVEALPYAEDAAITVEIVALTPPPGETDVEGRRGVFAWTLDLAPGASRELRVAYRLRWPGDRQLFVTPRPLDPAPRG